MGMIFQQTSSALIWLEESDKNTTVAFQMLKYLASLAKAEGITAYSHIEYNCGSGMFDRPLLNILDLYMRSDRDNWSVMFELLQRDWFRRVCVIQEATLARTASVACGTERIDWSDVITVICLIDLIAIRQLELRLYSQPHLQKEVRRIVNYSELPLFHFPLLHFPILVKGEFSIGNLFRVFARNRRRQLLATDSRDSIYSVLFLMAEPHRFIFTVRHDEQWTTKCFISKPQSLFSENVGLTYSRRPEIKVAVPRRIYLDGYLTVSSSTIKNRFSYSK
jgi:hypothetical protein